MQFLPKTFLIGKLAGVKVEYLPGIPADFDYVIGSTGLAATAGGLLLLDNSKEVVDEIGWTSKGDTIKENTVVGLGGGESLQRYYFDEEFVAKGDVSDFVVAAPSPVELLRTETPEIDLPAIDPITPSPKIAPPAPIIRTNPPIYINELFGSAMS